MKFNDVSDLANSLCYGVDKICGSTSTGFPLEEKALWTNSALNSYFHIAMRTSGNWSVEDKNNTDTSIATTDLISGQQDYSFPSDLLVVEKIRMKDSAGNWIVLDPVDDITHGTEVTGTPKQYRKFGNSFYLLPTVNYDSDEGLELTYRRAFDYVTAATTTTQLGIPNIHQAYMLYSVALPYLVSKGIASKNDIVALQKAEIANIESYYDFRKQDEITQVQPVVRNYR